jgi:hypothetical protein
MLSNPMVNLSSESILPGLEKHVEDTGTWFVIIHGRQPVIHEITLQELHLMTHYAG